MESAKKVKAEVVDEFGRRVEKESKFLKKIRRYWFRVKLGIAILLDVIDFFIAWLPIVNTAWDIVCFIILLLILKNKKLALLSLVELPLELFPPLTIIDMFLPMCTLVVLMDSGDMTKKVYVKRGGF